MVFQLDSGLLQQYGRPPTVDRGKGAFGSFLEGGLRGYQYGAERKDKKDAAAAASQLARDKLAYEKEQDVQKQANFTRETDLEYDKFAEQQRENSLSWIQKEVENIRNTDQFEATELRLGKGVDQEQQKINETKRNNRITQLQKALDRVLEDEKFQDKKHQDKIQNILSTLEYLRKDTETDLKIRQQDEVESENDIAKIDREITQLLNRDKFDLDVDRQELAELIQQKQELQQVVDNKTKAAGELRDEKRLAMEMEKQGSDIFLAETAGAEVTKERLQTYARMETEQAHADWRLNNDQLKEASDEAAATIEREVPLNTKLPKWEGLVDRYFRVLAHPSAKDLNATEMAAIRDKIVEEAPDKGEGLRVAGLSLYRNMLYGRKAEARADALTFLSISSKELLSMKYIEGDPKRSNDDYIQAKVQKNRYKNAKGEWVVPEVDTTDIYYNKLTEGNTDYANVGHQTLEGIKAERDEQRIVLNGKQKRDMEVWEANLKVINDALAIELAPATPAEIGQGMGIFQDVNPIMYASIENEDGGDRKILAMAATVMRVAKARSKRTQGRVSFDAAARQIFLTIGTREVDTPGGMWGMLPDGKGTSYAAPEGDRSVTPVEGWKVSGEAGAKVPPRKMSRADIATMRKRYPDRKAYPPERLHEMWMRENSN